MIILLVAGFGKILMLSAWLISPVEVAAETNPLTGMLMFVPFTECTIFPEKFPIATAFSRTNIEVTGIVPFVAFIVTEVPVFDHDVPPLTETWYPNGGVMTTLPVRLRASKE